MFFFFFSPHPTSFQNSSCTLCVPMFLISQSRACARCEGRPRSSRLRRSPLGACARSRLTNEKNERLPAVYGKIRDHLQSKSHVTLLHETFAALLPSSTNSSSYISRHRNFAILRKFLNLGPARSSWSGLPVISRFRPGVHIEYLLS